MAFFRAVFILGLFSAILVACSTKAPQYRLGPVGGFGGNAFDEYNDQSVPYRSELSSVDAGISGDICGFPGVTLVRYISSAYIHPSPEFTAKHGGNLQCCGTSCFTAPVRINLGQGEFLTGIYGRAGANVDRLFFVSNKSGFNSFDEIEWEADQIASGGNPFFLLAPPGYKVTRWLGRSGAVVDAIGFRAEEESALPNTGFPWYKLGAVGGWGGGAFEDKPVSTSVMVINITVTAGCYVTGVRFKYTDTRLYAHHGRDATGIIDGCATTTQSVDLDPDEFVRGINGRSAKYIDQLEFVTNKRTIGPFGGDGGEPFYLLGPHDYRVKRLFGRSGALIDALGIIVEK